MKVRLLFKCQHKGENLGWSGNTKVGSVKLGPFLPAESDPGHAEVKAFYAATPGGQIEFATINEAALAEFEVGAEYYITIERRVVKEQD
ncbi:MAG TPA: hypothetical protein VFN76_10070 [Candidatus Limnocylindria bacterium]|nr:hypothetical protein [Candidatus Limnocylindria bacterium]